MREEVVTYCTDCPDLAGCAKGYDCDVVRLVHKSCAEQGVPVKVPPGPVLDDVIILFGGKVRRDP